MSKLILILSALVVLSVSLTAQSPAAQPYTDAWEVDLLQLLPPPPAPGSDAVKAELDTLVEIQKTRTQAQADRAVADNVETIWRFADAVANPGFAKEKLPVFTAFFDRIAATEAAVVDPAKDRWNRTRPFEADSRLSPLLSRKASPSYPSGHTTLGTIEGILLGDMVPEIKPAVMARAWEYSRNRLVAGMHYPSDVEGGHLAGTAIAAVLWNKPEFRTEFEAAKAELRAVLGYR